LLCHSGHSLRYGSHVISMPESSKYYTFRLYTPLVLQLWNDDTEILGRRRPSARVSLDATSTLPRPSLISPLCLACLYVSPLRLSLPISRSLSCPLAVAEPCAATAASFLHPSRPCRLPPQFAQCLPNPALSRCITAVARRHCPCHWRLGVAAEAP
jgi:hypothetical protein